MRLEEPRHLIRQKVVAERIARRFKCEWHEMGPYSPFDVYLIRDREIKALVEIKTREDRELNSFSSVMINLDKWFTLMQAEVGLGIAGLFVVAFTDGIWYVRIGQLPVRGFKIVYRGRTDRPDAKNDVMPAIEVPSNQFTRVCDSDGVFED